MAAGWGGLESAQCGINVRQKTTSPLRGTPPWNHPQNLTILRGPVEENLERNGKNRVPIRWRGARRAGCRQRISDRAIKFLFFLLIKNPDKIPAMPRWTGRGAKKEVQKKTVV